MVAEKKRGFYSSYECFEAFVKAPSVVALPGPSSICSKRSYILPCRQKNSTRRSKWRLDVNGGPHSPRERQSQQSTNDTTKPYQFSLTSRITNIPRKEWDELASCGSESPFLEHDWLRSLEESGCVNEQTGWAPRHILMRDTNTKKLLAVAPCYIKLHSFGEFVFDQEWARAAYGAGVEYYPKLLVAVPFTPATGRRILTRDGGRSEILEVFARGLIGICRQIGLSSVHVTFCEGDEIQALNRAGFLMRKDIQYHFTNYRKGNAQLENGSSITKIPYTTFDDYLGEFKSKKRIKLRRERRSVYEDSGIDVSVLTGDDITDDIFEPMYHIYKSTIDKMFYGRQYLTKSFFSKLRDSPEFRKNLCFVVARRGGPQGEIIAGTFNLVKKGRMYGRYWGCFEEVKNLHFEVCYYRAIQYCIDEKMESMEPGAGGGEFKYGRGFEPVTTMSAHYLCNEALREAVDQFVSYEANFVDRQVDYLCENSVLRSKQNGR